MPHDFINRFNTAFAGLITVPSGTYSDGAAANTVTFKINGVTTNTIVSVTAQNAGAGDFDADGLHVSCTADTITFTFDDITLAADAKFHLICFNPN